VVDVEIWQSISFLKHFVPSLVPLCRILMAVGQWQNLSVSTKDRLPKMMVTDQLEYCLNPWTPGYQDASVRGAGQHCQHPELAASSHSKT
jgi:hypothetical protein